MLRCECGQLFHEPSGGNVHCRCGRVHTPDDRASMTAVTGGGQDYGWIVCPDRGPLVAALHESQGCGCGGVIVHECGRYREKVTLRPVSDRGCKTLTMEWDNYRGRNCQTCLRGCQNSQPQLLPEISIRNCLYHCCPLKKNDGWRKASEQLLRRIDLFNGRRCVAVAVDAARCEPLEAVAELFSGRAELFPFPNDRELRETATLLPLLQMVANPDSSQATFYCHSKANSTRDSVIGATRWRNAMFHHLLDRSGEVEQVLHRYPVAGTTKFRWAAKRPFRFPTGLTRGTWMFSGTFWWFRHDAIFTLPTWQDIPRDRYGTESWLAGMIPDEQAHSMFQPWPPDRFPPGSPYDVRYYGPEFDDP